MTEETIFNKALKAKCIIISQDELNSILNCSIIFKEEDTHLSDFIRILTYNNSLFIQEISFKKEIILRKMNSIEDAENFLAERLSFYERKWDGCGCKIDYFE